MKPTSVTPTTYEIMCAFQKQFPDCRLADAEIEFLAAIAHARDQKVGYGWMRQVTSIAWRTEDPDGYLDDDRIVELFARKR